MYAAFNMEREEVVFEGHKREVRRFMKELMKKNRSMDSEWSDTVMVRLDRNGEVKKVYLWE